ncbi:MAG TPA: OmpA family protein [Candidatus Aquilonibacter sp.]|nr:OmpA family protein [Candidatus Aquilonibacter sp.]
MKTMKLIYPLVFALAVTLASTGCKHEPTNVTRIPGPAPAIVDNEGGNNTLSGGGTMSPENGVGEQGGGPLAGLKTFDGMAEDTNTLAPDTIHFAFDSAVIRDSEQASLQAVAQALAANPSDKLLIQGNCDERGTEEYNRALGERRALAAREALAKLGVDPMRVRTISFGKDNPVDPGHDEAAWAENRRDDFVLLLPQTGT